LPEAINCKVEPTIIFAGEDGVISMEDSLGVVFDTHATMPNINDTTNNNGKKIIVKSKLFSFRRDFSFLN